ncbi:MAG: polyribonucleotide nucleotidyltransferase [Flavobacteriales bacterium]|nr:polyribonucleotide nucleotidyltransferase [Flavobacteriales bacterium]
MIPEAIKQTVDVGNGVTITLETGKLAKQADGSVIVRAGNCMLMATVVSATEAREGTDFLPLSVDYLEKYYAAGKFPGGFFKREARPSNSEILVSRLVDRALRPMFPSDYHSETQMIIQLISHDENIMPDALAGFAASAALAVSDIPFGGPISEVRVALINGQYVVNPSKSQLAGADMDMIIAGTATDINMVEGEMNECSEEQMLEAIKVGHEAIKKQIQAQLDLAAKVEKSKVKREYNHETNDADFKQKVYDFCYPLIYEMAKSGSAKQERSAALSEIKEKFVETLSDEEKETLLPLLGGYFKYAQKRAVRDCVLNERVRLDGRKTTDIRPIWTEIDYLPSTHGSSIFTRGETQSLTTVTLGGKLDEQRVDSVTHEGFDNFYLHYNFPPFSTGEARFLRGVGRREIGHGNLAERALKKAMPSDFPYTTRVVSEILESNGSSSMATVCAGSLALMDAGVPIKSGVSGIAMGLIYDEGKYAILSDILGDEDFLGDMDFKVAGTKDGITAVQMDMKVDGLPYEVLAEALHQAKDGRAHILNEMNKTIAAAKPEMKDHAPRIVSMVIPKDMIGAVIGPGGKIIQEMQEVTGATINIEEIDGKGHIQIMADNKQSIDAAVGRIKAITAVPEVGEVYHGKVKNIQPFGAFIEIMPGKDGLLHISEIEWKRLEKVEDALKEGDMVDVKLIAIDEKTGKLKLSRKVLLPKPERKEEPSKN